MELRYVTNPPEAEAAGEFDIEEASGILEIPITGWVLHPRSDNVRIVGYINRGTLEHPRREATVILHVPMSGFLRSLARMRGRWLKEMQAVH